MVSLLLALCCLADLRCFFACLFSLPLAKPVFFEAGMLASRPQRIPIAGRWRQAHDLFTIHALLESRVDSGQFHQRIFKSRNQFETSERLLCVLLAAILRIIIYHHSSLVSLTRTHWLLSAPNSFCRFIQARSKSFIEKSESPNEGYFVRADRRRNSESPFRLLCVVPLSSGTVDTTSARLHEKEEAASFLQRRGRPWFRWENSRRRRSVPNFPRERRPRSISPFQERRGAIMAPSCRGLAPVRLHGLRQVLPDQGQRVPVAGRNSGCRCVARNAGGSVRAKVRVAYHFGRRQRLADLDPPSRKGGAGRSGRPVFVAVVVLLRVLGPNVELLSNLRGEAGAVLDVSVLAAHNAQRGRVER